MKRSKHTLSHYSLRTGKLGKLMPVMAVPVLPGDTIQGYHSGVIRLAPLNTPVMHPMTVRIHDWFVPNRIVDDTWEDFITGGTSGEETPARPTVQQSTLLGTPGEYMGFPRPATTSYDINAHPIRAFNHTYNQRYRDQDTVAERSLDNNTNLPFCAWEKDYFTTARPFSQRGPEVSLPVKGGPTGANVILDNPDADGYDIATGGAVGTYSTTSGNPNLFVPNANEFRAMFALQRYQEARAKYGARFTEYLRYLGVTPSDARLQEPEYLGGGSGRVNFSEVLQTSPNEISGSSQAEGVGDLYGHGISGLRTPKWRRFFEEHGYIITVVSVRPKAVYTHAIQREALKRTKEDYFQKELQAIGQQEITQQELHCDTTVGARENVWGWQDRYSEYTWHPSTVANEFRTTLNSWNLAREYLSSQALNQAFTDCDPDDRIFQAGGFTDQLWMMLNHHIVARRMVSKRVTPRVM